ncbi:MAG: amidohydrolase family protein [Bacteroidia bacterium]|nr:amidohydrolase family protein [Bacteroidia bacterium]
MNTTHRTTVFLLLLFQILFCPAQLDIVLKGGRVMDPETGLDAIRNVGIRGDRIVEISRDELEGKEVIDVSGLVVSPGFIDLHVHGQTNAAHKYQARDGVTTALELEGGMPFLKEWIKSKEGKTIVNYGATVPHALLRALAMKEYRNYLDQAKDILKEKGFEAPELFRLQANLQTAGYRSLTEDDLVYMRELLLEELEKGALGVGVPVGYYPGATAGEIYKVYQFAAEKGVPVFSHTRGFGMPGIQEAISNATASGAPLHIVHANSLSLGEIQVTLDMVEDAQKNGLDVTTEVYPYTAASTSLESAIFDEGWQEKLGISYGDIQWEATGERLTEATFKEYREKGGIVIIHMMKPEWIEKGIADPRTMIGSDGMPYHPKAHPRTAGTFSRVLGRYVREKKVIGLMDALRKMTLMPAQRLEEVAPSMHLKGRLQVGADADITIFDPETIIDKADFKGLQYSEGVTYVLVNGVFVVKEGKNVEGAFPGRAVVGKYRN